MNKNNSVTRGAGKPALYGKAMKRTNVMLDEETIAFYTEHGEGNLSEGIRQYWRSLTQHAPDVANAAPQKGVLHKNRSGKRTGVA